MYRRVPNNQTQTEIAKLVTQRTGFIWDFDSSAPKIGVNMG
jgi:hypothetical protein